MNQIKSNGFRLAVMLGPVKVKNCKGVQVTAKKAEAVPLPSL